jgi:hypothetical protein
MIHIIDGTTHCQHISPISDHETNIVLLHFGRIARIFITYLPLPPHFNWETTVKFNYGMRIDSKEDSKIHILIYTITTLINGLQWLKIFIMTVGT